MSPENSASQPSGRPTGDGTTVPYAFGATPASLIDTQLKCIEDCYDPTTVAQLSRTGVVAGWRCWEIGAGGGSITRWLSDRVGPEGTVLATDLTLDRVPDGPNIERLRHDVATDELPGTGFDLIHARLVLQHLPERYKVLDRLAAALRPGGWLVLEDFDCRYLPALTGDEAKAELYDRVMTTMMDSLADAGVDLAWGARTFDAIRAAGLTDVSGTTFAVACPGGTSGSTLFAINALQLRDKMLAAGVSTSDLDSFQALLADPGFAVGSYALVSSKGRRSGQGA